MHPIADLPSGLYIFEACVSWSKETSPSSDWLSFPSVKDFGIFLSPPGGAGVATLPPELALTRLFAFTFAFAAGGVGVGRPATCAKLGDLSGPFRKTNAAAEPKNKTITNFVRFFISAGLLKPRFFPNVNACSEYAIHRVRFRVRALARIKKNAINRGL